MATNDKENNEFLDENPDADNFEGDELTLNDIQTNWIKNPKVGEKIEFCIKRIVKNKNYTVKGKDGKTFDKNLSKVDYAVEIHTDKNAIFTVPNWETWGKIRAICRKLQRIAGVDIRIEHIKDGSKDKSGDSYRVSAKIDGAYCVLGRKSNEWEKL